ncbi:hypothetical protein K474DRAFT_1609646 [Panus rudis PR-1116 ss-1]|nr:hypothetical protein K474DRAFT_1609646 [Panus rudis PR-1116 ss-1]
MEDEEEGSQYDYEENGSQYGSSDNEDFEDEAPDAPGEPSSSGSSSSSNSPHPSPSPPSSPSLSASPGPAVSSGSSSDTSRSSTPADHLASLAARNARLRVEKALRQDIHIKPFPFDTAGAPLDERDPAAHAVYGANVHGSEQNPYAPFTSEMDWKLAEWAKKHNIGSNAFTELLSIDRFVDSLGLSYRNTRELNAIIDKDIPAFRPRFECREVTLEDEGVTVELYLRDIMQCIRALYGDPKFAPHLIVKPEQHFLDEDQTDHVWHDMHTGDWWWMMQMILEDRSPGATILPLILSSDKTEIALFRGKTAYPLYMTLGNIPKDIRRKPSQKAYVLLGYLPTSNLEEINIKAKRRRVAANIFHLSLREILAPTKIPASNGEVMASGDGVCRRNHPILAAYACDYLDQVVVTGALYGDCPICDTPHNHLGDPDYHAELRNLEHIQHILAIADEVPRRYLQACRDARIKPIYQPFWADLPGADIFLSITPDTLHQLYQGILKHLLAWVKSAYSQVEIDARCQRLPPNHHIRSFLKGITSLTKLTGQEHADIARILLGLIIDLPLPNNLSPIRLVKATRALLDFIYLAQYPIHNSATLDAMEEAMNHFDNHKSIFIDLNIRKDWNLPKLHVVARHYRLLIERFGTTDNFNTQFFERLHIEVAKDAADATNWKDEFPQMTLWLERNEKISRHANYIQWRQAGCPPLSTTNPLPLPLPPLKMTKHPSLKAVAISHLEQEYHAAGFKEALCYFILHFNNPGSNNATLRREARNFLLPFTHLPVYHRAKFWRPDFPHFQNTMEAYDVLHVRPKRKNYRNDILPPRFDTALVNIGDGNIVGIEGYRVAQVKVIFSIPKGALPLLFNQEHRPPLYLAYVEWFTPFGEQPEEVHGLYKVSHAVRDGKRLSAVIPLVNIHRSVHLIPQFGPQVNREWTSSNVLEVCTKFYVNCFTDRHTYGTLL